MFVYISYDTDLESVLSSVIISKTNNESRSVIVSVKYME